uniref:Permease YjgP/YjgQ n=1 Tax=Chlorobium chlorochromatii (strain CaD3) TaxID=340177 RepID=Q3ATU7_CHLCH
MKILERYIFQQFIKAFLFTALVFVSLFIIINMIEKLGNFMDHHVSALEIARYYLLSIPSIFLVTSPVSALLASILVAGKLATQNELPAIRSAGVSMRQLLTPFAWGALLLFLFNFFNAGWLAPTTYSHNRTFEQLYLGKNAGDQETRNLHLLDSGNRFISIGAFNPINESLNNVSIERLSGATMISRIDADSMHYNRRTKRWTMWRVTERYFSNGYQSFTTKPTATIRLALRPKALHEMRLQPDEITLPRHYQFLREKEEAGFSGLERSAVKFHNKIAMPFASLIITLIGVPLAARKKRGGIAAEIAITLFIGFLYLGIQRTIAIAGYQGVLPPIVAAWLPNLLFLVVGWVLYKKSTDS